MDREQERLEGSGSPDSGNDDSGNDDASQTAVPDLEVDLHLQAHELYTRSSGDFLLGLELVSPLHDVNQAIFTPILLDMEMPADTLDLLREGLTLALERPDILDEDDDAAIVAFSPRRSRVVFGGGYDGWLHDERRMQLLDVVERLPEIQEEETEDLDGEGDVTRRSHDVIQLAMASALEEIVLHGTRYNFVLLISSSGERMEAEEAGKACSNIRRMLESVEQKSSQCIRVYGVAIGEQCDTQLLQKLASESGGSFVHAEDGYDAVAHIQEHLAQFSTLVATDATVTLTPTLVNGKPVIRSVADVADEDRVRVVAGPERSDGARPIPVAFEVRFGDAFAEESYQKLIRLDLDLSEVVSEHAALPIASCVLSYSKVDGVYSQSSAAAFNVATKRPEEEDGERCHHPGLPAILYFVPEPIRVSEAAQAETDAFVMRHMTKEAVSRIKAQLEQVEARQQGREEEDEEAGEGSDGDGESVVSECLHILDCLCKWPVSLITKRQEVEVQRLRRQLLDRGAVPREVVMPTLDADEPAAEGHEDQTVAASSDDVPPPAAAETVAEKRRPSVPVGSGRRRWKLLQCGTMARSIYKSSRKREKTSQLFAETIHEHHEKLEAAQEEEEEAAGEGGSGANARRPSRKPSVPATGSEGKAMQMKNMADEGEMSEGIRAIEDRLVKSGERREQRGAVSSGDDSELARRLRQRAAKRQELVERYGSSWADCNIFIDGKSGK